MIGLKIVFSAATGGVSLCLAGLSLSEPRKSLERWAGLLLASLFAVMAVLEAQRAVTALLAAGGLS